MSSDLAVRGATALTIADGQNGWTPQQLSTLEQLGVAGAGEGDLAVFFHQSVRTGLDPFAKQIYMIARNERALLPSGEWGNVQKWTIQTGIDGYRLVARRAADRAGVQLTYEDTVWCGPDGNWRDVWLQPQPPLAAKVVVYRGAERFSAVAHWPEYVQTKRDGEPNSMWARMGRNQLAKCAEALALRKAFPQDLSGIYTDDEMGQADSRAEALAAEEADRAAARSRPAPARATATRPAPERPAAQAPRVVDGESTSGPAAADAPVTETRPADGPATAAPARDWLAEIAAVTDAASGSALWNSCTDADLATDVEDPSGNSFTVRERIIARVEDLQRYAGKPVAPDGPPAAAAPVDTGDGTAEAPLEGELLDPGAPAAATPDAEDLRRNTPQRRATVTELTRLFHGRDAMAAAAEQMFGLALDDVATNRLRKWMGDLQREAAAAPAA